MSIRLVSAAFLGFAALSGVLTVVSADTTHTSTVASCEAYTDSSNCDYDNQY